MAVAVGGAPAFTGPRWLPTAGAPARTMPNVSATPMAPAQPGQPGHTTAAWPLVVVVIVALIAAAVFWFVLRAVLRGRTRAAGLPLQGAGLDPDAGDVALEALEQEPEPDAPRLRRGLQEALGALDGEREPADAIVRAWLGLQAAAEESGVQRRPAETPTEFTGRVIARVRADGSAARTLVDVYQAVRFGGHPITPAEIQDARTAIGALLASWHEPALGRRR